jgi:hypothetical protein
MTWFKVDDSFHAHPKVLAADPAALGLWVVAGAWCSANLTDGQVPTYVLPRLIPGSEALAARLVDCGLWKRSKGGFRFHDWADYNPCGESVKEERAAARERMRTLRAKRRTTAGKTANNPAPEQAETGGANPETTGQAPDCSGEQDANVRPLFVTPTRPDPTRTSYGSNKSVGAASGAARKRATRLPDDFAVTDDMKAWFRTDCPGVDGTREHAKFVDYWTAKSGKDATKADWVATWRNWMRKAHEDTSRRDRVSTSANRHIDPMPPDKRRARNPFIGAVRSSQTGATA